MDGTVDVTLEPLTATATGTAGYIGTATLTVDAPTTTLTLEQHHTTELA